MYRSRFRGQSCAQLRRLTGSCVGPRLGRRSIAQPFDEPLSVVPADELPNEPPGLLEGFEAVQVEALLLQRPQKALDDPVTLGFADVEIVIPSHLTSSIQASATYWGSQSHRSFSPRATSFANDPKAWGTPRRIGSSAAQRSPRLATCQPTSSSMP